MMRDVLKLFNIQRGLYRCPMAYRAWLLSDAKERLWAYRLMQERKVFRAEHPYTLYLSHSKSDLRGLEALHQRLSGSFATRSKQFNTLVHYPQYMSLLFLSVKTFMVHTPSVYSEACIYGALWLVVASACRISNFDAFNRYVLRGKAQESQMPFELWTVLACMQEQGISWQEIPLGNTLLLKEMQAMFRSMQAHSLEDYLATCGGHAYKDVDEAREDCEKHYYAESLRWSLMTAGLYYGFIVFIAVHWLLWVAEPIQALERQWMGL